MHVDLLRYGRGPLCVCVHCTEATTSAARSSIAFDIVELKDAPVAMKTMIAHSCAVGSGNSLLG